jgi:parallel beta-helix repeat protein
MLFPDIIDMMLHIKIAVVFIWFALLGEANATTITVNPGDSIQAVIYASSAGDTILVNGGTYYEHLNVNKPLTITGQNMPILDATSSGCAIVVSADGVFLKGFKTINSGRWPYTGSEEAGIQVISSDCIIEGNNASNNSNGILITAGNNNTITKNTASGNLGFGIKLTYCHGNAVFENNFYRNHGGNAYDSGTNRWDNGTIGNYYGDFNSAEQRCQDANGNGICDSSCAIPGGSSIDGHPSIYPLNF